MAAWYRHVLHGIHMDCIFCTTAPICRIHLSHCQVLRVLLCVSSAVVFGLWLMMHFCLGSPMSLGTRV